MDRASYLLGNQPNAGGAIRVPQLIWEQWYPKYEPLLYGIILQLTGNKTRAGRILKEVTSELNGFRISGWTNQVSMIRTVFNHVYHFTLNHLSDRGMTPVEVQPFGEKFPLLYLLYFEFNTIGEVAAKLSRSRQEVMADIRKEFKVIRGLNVAQPAFIRKYG